MVNKFQAVEATKPAAIQAPKSATTKKQQKKAKTKAKQLGLATGLIAVPKPSATQPAEGRHLTTTNQPTDNRFSAMAVASFRWSGPT